MTLYVFLCVSICRTTFFKFIDVKVRKLWKFKLIKEGGTTANQQNSKIENYLLVKTL